MEVKNVKTSADLAEYLREKFDGEQVSSTWAYRIEDAVRDINKKLYIRGMGRQSAELKVALKGDKWPENNLDNVTLGYINFRSTVSNGKRFFKGFEVHDIHGASFIIEEEITKAFARKHAIENSNKNKEEAFNTKLKTWGFEDISQFAEYLRQNASYDQKKYIKTKI